MPNARNWNRKVENVTWLDYDYSEENLGMEILENN